MQNDEYNNILRTECRHLFDKKLLFRAKFLYINDKGHLVLQFSVDSPIPRKDSLSQYIIFLKKEDRVKGAIDCISYQELLVRKVFLLSGKFIWSQPFCEGGRNFIRAGYNGIEISKISTIDIQSYKDCFVYIGVSRPPLEMLENLIAYTTENPDNPFFTRNYYNDAGSYDIKPLTDEMRNPSCICKMLASRNDPLIIQGPPGTGKSYLIASLVQDLISCNMSVLVTTLSNRALLEIIKKDPLLEPLKNKLVFKKALSVDEENQVSGRLLDLDDVKPVNGKVHFCTYYSSSCSGFVTGINPPSWKYDFVIVDEAGQAFLPFLAATMSMGNKQIFIGDINQLPPVVVLNDDQIKNRKYYFAANGLHAASQYLTAYQLTSTYRLCRHSASLTQLFYKYSLISRSNIKFQLKLDLNARSLALEPGTYLISYGSSGYSSSDILLDICHQLEDVRPVADKPRTKSRIAIISQKVNDVADLQKLVRTSLRSISEDRLIVDTVYRCQGMTTDFAIFVIPSRTFSLFGGCRLFNVATSRAKIINFILCPNSFVNAVRYVNDDIGAFVNKLIADAHVISI